MNYFVIKKLVLEQFSPMNMLLLQAADSMSGRTPRETSNAEELSKIVGSEPTDVVDRVLNDESERITSSKKRNNKPRLDIS